MIASQRMDGAALGAMRLAIGKAYTAVLWGTPSGYFTESTQPGGDDWGFNVSDERIVVYAGGVPLFVGAGLIGAVGASGGTAEQDEACVTAARALDGIRRRVGLSRSPSGSQVPSVRKLERPSLQEGQS